MYQRTQHLDIICKKFEGTIQVLRQFLPHRFDYADVQSEDGVF